MTDSTPHSDDQAHETLPARSDQTLPPQQADVREDLALDGYSTLPSGRIPSAPPGVQSSSFVPAEASPAKQVPSVPTGSSTGLTHQVEITQANDASRPQSESGRSEPSPSELSHERLPDDTVLPSKVVADYATVAPSLKPIAPLPESQQSVGQSSLSDSLAASGGLGSRTDPVQSVRYHILREHAKGGLGKVFVAEDLELHREVAFKEIQKKFADDRETQIRFLREAKITGGLEHPGIVPVYGLGTYADGRPYYAMRFIRGRSLQQAIMEYYHSKVPTPDEATRQHEFRQLLRRFIDVCDALEYAHAQGIIHRDLKPGNIMLGEYGETLVVDWGLAKSFVEPEPEYENPTSSSNPRSRLSVISGDGSLHSLAGTVTGTPQFMSPEQAQGRDEEMRPASDIYSLGATLYCILTGTGAFTGRTVKQLIEQVIAGEFAAPQQVQQHVPNALNAICLKAMALAPDQRYTSARAMAEDIEHWLADEPVLAYPESRRERFNRWFRKHQARVQAIGIAVIAVAVVSLFAAILIDQSRRAEAKANHDLEIANAAEIQAKQEVLRRSSQTRDVVDTVLSGMSDALKSFPGTQARRIRLLEYAAAEYAKLTEDNSDDPELKAEAARNLVRLGDVRLLLKPSDPVMKEYSQAVREFTRLSELYPNNPDYRYETARTYIQMGVALARQEQRLQANQRFQSAIDILNPLTEESTDNQDYEDALATALINAGRVRNDEGDFQEAETLLRQGLEKFEQLHRKHRKSLRFATAKAKALSAMGRFLLERDRAVEADKLFNKSLMLREDVYSAAEDPDSFADQASVKIDLSNAFRALGRWPDAARNYQSAVDDFQELVRVDPNAIESLNNLVIAQTNLGPILRRLGRNAEAIKVLEKSLENLRGLDGYYEPAYLYRTSATARVTLAQALSELGQQDKALEVIKLALDDCQQRIDFDPMSLDCKHDYAIALGNQGRILVRSGDFSAGLEKYTKAIEILDQLAMQDPETPGYRNQLASTWTQVGNLAFQAKDIDQATRAFQAALQIRQQLLKEFPQNPQFQDSFAWFLATCPLENLRDAKLALNLAQAATGLVPESPHFQLTLAAAEYRNQQTEAALKVLKLAFQDDNLRLYVQALCEIDLKQLETAKKTFAAGQAWRKEKKPLDEESLHWEREIETRLGLVH